MENTDINQVKLLLKSIIVNDLDMNIALEDIEDNLSLYEDGIGLDSINVVNFLVLIEDRFNIKLEGNEINSTVFGSINSIAKHITPKLGGKIQH
ncbi:MAG: phosphopantetheine-binding protein [Cytophagales bacterium]|nr:phosphopantetheine-binding protein [Cytophagales bacterium]